MARYPAQPLEEKLAWMKERMQGKSAREAKGETVLRAPSPARHRRAQLVQAKIPAHLEMFTVAEVAQMLAVSPSTVRRYFAGKVVMVGRADTTPSRRRYRKFFISRRDLEQWLEEHRR
jgi:hypothetical protein